VIGGLFKREGGNGGLPAIWGNIVAGYNWQRLLKRGKRPVPSRAAAPETAGICDYSLQEQAWGSDSNLTGSAKSDFDL
jgi:hypothetical protein